MSVCITGLQLKCMGFMHSLRAFLGYSAIDDIDIAMEDDDRLENKSRDRRQSAAQ